MGPKPPTLDPSPTPTPAPTPAPSPTPTLTLTLNQVPYYTSAPNDAIAAAVGRGGGRVAYDDGSDPARAAALAAQADVALVFVATDSSEGADRRSLSLDDGADALIAAVAAANPKTVVAAVAPGAVLTPWRDAVAAVTLAFMPGQEYGHALSDVLFGVTSPSAKLPLTMPTSEDDLNLTAAMWPGVDTPGGCDGQPNAHCTSAVYSEKLLVGYRYYDQHHLKPAYAFGHGLTYSSFKLSDLQLTPNTTSTASAATSATAATTAALYTVSVTLKNTGQRVATETPQLYLRFPIAAGEPPQQLKGFTKVSLAAGGSQVVSFALTARKLSVWDATAHAWTEAKGTFTATVGTSSRDDAALSVSFEHGTA